MCFVPCKSEHVRCTVCNYIGESKDFSTTNRSKDGSKAVCKACRRVTTQERRVKIKEKTSKLPWFDLAPTLLKTKNKARIGILIMNNFVDRESRKKKGFYNINVRNVGLTAILDELKEPYEYCPPAAINQFEYVLVSLTSVMDVENIVYSFEVYGPSERKCKIVIGGFGVINIKLIVSYIDIAVFGRAEGQINEILAGRKYPNVWRKADDPKFKGQYIIRQAQYLVKGERSVGCRNTCLYCQYTHVRQSIGDATLYDPGMITQETDWNGLEITKAGRYNSAWDGWSDVSRKKVHKPVTNALIRRKLMEIDSLDIKGGINIKIFMIVGYPWESMETVMYDIEQTTTMLREIDVHLTRRIYLSFLCTPFSPEPMTPMQYERADIETDWRMLGGKSLLNGKHIKAYILPFISGSFLLMKRVLINRADINDLDLFKRLAFSKELLSLPESLRVKWLFKYNVINSTEFNDINFNPVDYLTTPARSERQLSLKER